LREKKHNLSVKFYLRLKYFLNNHSDGHTQSQFQAVVEHVHLDNQQIVEWISKIDPKSRALMTEELSSPFLQLLYMFPSVFLGSLDNKLAFTCILLFLSRIPLEP